MHLDVVPCKTSRARDLLQRRGTLPRSQRVFLIMVDGRKSLRELSEAAGQLGIDNVALAAMANGGLIQWSRDAGQPLVSQVTAAPASPSPASSGASLAAGKMYAMDLLALLLPGQDSTLREAARGVTDEAALRAWIHRCLDDRPSQWRRSREVVSRSRRGSLAA